MLPSRSINGGNDSAETGLAPLAIVLLAIGQLIGLYPVSSAQIALPCFLMAICTGTVVRDVAAESGYRFHARFGLPVWRTVLICLTSLGVLGAAGLFYRQVAVHWAAYRDGVALNLPGAHTLHLDRGLAATLRCSAANLRNSQPSFVTIPGMSSFYPFGGKAPPTGFNATMNFALLSADEQRQIVEVGRQCRPICLVLNRDLLFHFWTKERRSEPAGPLIDFMNTECRSIGRIGNYEFLRHRDQPAPEFIYGARFSREWHPEQVETEVVVTVPATAARITAASLLRTSRPAVLVEKQTVHPTALVEHSGAAGGWQRSQEFTLRVPDGVPLLASDLNSWIVQLWDDTGHEIDDVPFFRVPSSL